jgi:uncharacterized membrane protein
MTPSPPSARHTVLARLRRWFLTGIVVTAPLFLTVFFTLAFLNYVDTTVSRIIPPEYNPNTHLPFSVPGLGLVAAIAFFVCAGWFATNFLGRTLIGVSEYFLDRMPVIRSLYGAIKQLFETVMASKSTAFREVVMVEFPRPGAWVLGFVTGDTNAEIGRRTGPGHVNVFVPTAPLPTQGFLLFLPRTELRYLNMKVDDALKMIVSGGIVAPPDRDPGQGGSSGS